MNFARKFDVLTNTPILVTGTHRSGTTWVGRMLDFSSELGYINEIFNNGPFYGYYNPVFAGEFPQWFTYTNETNAYLYEAKIRDTLQFKIIKISFI